MDTVNSMNTMAELKPTMNFLPVSGNFGNETPNLNKGRRSSFSRYSIRENPSITITPSMQNVNQLKETPSIMINSIGKSGDVPELNLSIRTSRKSEDGGFLTASSRSNSNSRTINNSENEDGQGESSQESIVLDGEHSPIFREIKKLRGCYFQNPFYEDQNNAESLVSLKMGYLKTNTMSIKSLNNSRILEGKSPPHSNSDNILMTKKQI
jgi:hypothetical protein